MWTDWTRRANAFPTARQASLAEAWREMARKTAEANARAGRDEQPEPAAGEAAGALALA